MTADPSHTQLAEQVAELKKERDEWKADYQRASKQAEQYLGETRRWSEAENKTKLLHEQRERQLLEQIAALKAELAEARRALADERTEMNSVPRWEPIFFDRDGTKHGATMEFRADGAFICYAHAKAALAGAEGKA